MIVTDGRRCLKNAELPKKVLSLPKKLFDYSSPTDVVVVGQLILGDFSYQIGQFGATRSIEPRLR